MKIDNNSYYIRYWLYKGKEYADVTHYIKVWWNGERDDCFDFSRGHMGFEDASWTGIDSDEIDVGKTVRKQDFSKWKRRVTMCQKKIEQMAKQSAITFEGELTVGDCLYIPSKDIYIADWMEEFNEDISKEEGPYPCFDLIHITSTNPELQGTVVYIDRYCNEFFSEPRSLENFRELIEKSFYIPQEVFDNAANLLIKVSSEILEEIKKEYYT